MRYSVIVVLIALVVVGVGVYFLTLPAPVDVNAVRGYADPMTENLLVAMNEGNYNRFTQDLDSAMRSALTEGVFNQTASTIKSKIGSYVSKEFWKAERDGSFISAYYMARFTDEPAEVIVKTVFSETGERAYVSGLWFDSPKLRG